MLEDELNVGNDLEYSPRSSGELYSCNELKKRYSLSPTLLIPLAVILENSDRFSYPSGGIIERFERRGGPTFA